MRADLNGILAMVVAAGFAGCGNPSSNPEPGDAAADGTNDATSMDVADGDAVQRPPTDVTESFRLMLLREASDFKYKALVLADPRTPEWNAETGPIGVAGAPQDEESPPPVNPGIDCAMGCFTDPTRRWFAYVAQAPDGEDWNTQLVVGRLDEDLRFTPLEGTDPIPDVTDLAFAGDRLYVSQRVGSCDAVVGQPKPCWVYRRLDLSNPGPLGTLFTFPTPGEIHLSGHAGHFEVSWDGSTAVLQDPRPGTLRLWVWRDGASGGPGTLFAAGETICGPRVDGFDKCPETPGVFTDREPVAVAADGRLVVLAAVENDEALRLFAVEPDATDPTTFSRTRLAFVPLTADEPGFRTVAYYNERTAPFTRVQAGMRIVGSGDASELLFVGERRAPNQSGKENTRTHLAAIRVTALRQGNAEGLAPVRRITDFAAGNVPENVLIPEGGFDVSPGGEFVAFLGTPVLDSLGGALTAGMIQHENDQEVFVTRFDGTTEPVQLTGHFETRTWELRAVAAPGPQR